MDGKIREGFKKKLRGGGEKKLNPSLKDIGVVTCSRRRLSNLLEMGHVHQGVNEVSQV